MRSLARSGLWAITVAAALLLSAPPQQAAAQDEEAKACRKLGLSEGCITNGDIRRRSLSAEDVKNPAGADFEFRPTEIQDLGFTGKLYEGITLFAPGPGVVIVHASAYLVAEPGERGTAVCFFTQDGSNGLVPSNTTPFYGSVNAFRPPPGLPEAGKPVDLFYDYMSIVRGFEVSEADFIHFDLICKMQVATTARGPLGIGAPTITVQYFPTRYCVRKRRTGECR